MDRNENIDPVLEELVSAADRRDGPVPQITLMVGGCVISGVLASEAEYVRSTRLAKLQGTFGIPREDREARTEVIEAMTQQKLAEAREPGRKPQFIHVCPARIVYGRYVLEIGFWRGRLESVDGFNYGEYPAKISENASEDI